MSDEGSDRRLSYIVRPSPQSDIFGLSNFAAWEVRPPASLRRPFS